MANETATSEVGLAVAAMSACCVLFHDRQAWGQSKSDGILVLPPPVLIQIRVVILFAHCVQGALDDLRLFRASAVLATLSAPRGLGEGNFLAAGFHGAFECQLHW